MKQHSLQWRERASAIQKTIWSDPERKAHRLALEEMNDELNYASQSPLVPHQPKLPIQPYKSETAEELRALLEEIGV